MGEPVKEPAPAPPCPLDVQDEAVEADVEHETAERDEAAEQRIERVYREHGDRLWRAVFLTSGSREVADDAVAEAFAQAIRRGHALRDPAAWVWRAAFRIAAGELKDRSRMEGFDEGAVTGLPDPFVDLWRALARLPLKQRASVVMADYAGWSHREIAEALGSSVSAVGVHVHRARKRLRDLLEESDDE
jgi:DNA-directed RNA polymerase specialized sigma24 family protein